MKIEKIIKRLPTGFVDEAAAMDEKQLRAAIVDADTAIREAELARESDEDLKAAKQHAQDLAAPYGDAVNAQRAKVNYCLHLLEERGELGREPVAEAPTA